MAILSIHGVRSYQGEKPVEFDLSKYVTLIYGQNGSEKSTVSGYFISMVDQITAGAACNLHWI